MNKNAVLHVAYAGVETRARQSGGISDQLIYRAVANALDQREAGGILLDLGCGAGQLQPFIRHRFSEYIGADAIRYENFDLDNRFVQVDLDSGGVPLADESVDVAAAVEIIEHLENPRAFTREISRLVKPGGWLVITTPNQLSVLSLVTLIVKRRFSAFQDVHYPAHLTALLEVDLRRIASECGLTDVSIVYSKSGRIVLTPWHFPKFLSSCFPMAFSDTVLLIARKPVNTSMENSA